MWMLAWSPMLQQLWQMSRWTYPISCNNWWVWSSWQDEDSPSPEDIQELKKDIPHFDWCSFKFHIDSLQICIYVDRNCSCILTNKKHCLWLKLNSPTRWLGQAGHDGYNTNSKIALQPLSCPGYPPREAWRSKTSSEGQPQSSHMLTSEQLFVFSDGFLCLMN